MKSISLRLKGFKGLLAGMGVEEIFIDLEKLPEGLVAICGENGMGKTTILDNLQPYRLMPYKLRKSKAWSPGAFNYYDQCYGRDAQKEYIFEMNGLRYRKLLMIDAEKRKQEAYLYVKEGEDWKPLNDGKTATYDEAIERVCGTPSLFFTSVFRSQGAKNLSDHTRGDIMEMVSELLNIDHIKVQGEKAGEVVKHLKSITEIDRNKMDLLYETINSRGEVKESLEKVKESIVTEECSLRGAKDVLKESEENLAETEKKKASLDSEKKRLQEMESVQGNDIKERDELKKEVAEKNETFEASNHDITAKLQRANKIASGAEKIRAKEEEGKGKSERLNSLKKGLETSIERQEELSGKSKEHSNLREQISKAELDLSQAKAEHDKSINSVQTDIQKAELDLSQARSVQERNVHSVRIDLQQAQKEAERLEGIDCDGKGTVNKACRFITDAVTAKESIEGLKTNLLEAEKPTDTMTALEESLKELRSSLDEARKPTEAIKTHEVILKELHDKEDKFKDLDDLVRANNALLSETRREMSSIEKDLLEIAEFTKLIPELEQAEENIKLFTSELESRKNEFNKEISRINDKITAIDARISDREKEITALKESLGQDHDVLITDYKATIEGIKKIITGHEEEIKRLNAQAGGIQNKLDEIKLKKKEADDITEKIEKFNKEISVWALLARACSNDGIISLEIDDAGPGISGLANDLLSACYGSRFSVSLKTQSEKAKGGMKEDFDIEVYDSETGEAVSITEKSGGQLTYIEDSITRAICLFNIGKSERVFETLFSDEKDGALDEGKKRIFMEIKRKALEMGSHDREFFISQTRELQDMADGRIRLQKGGVVVEG